ARAVEIGRGLLDQRHAFSKQRRKRRRSGELLAERHSRRFISGSFVHYAYASPNPTKIARREARLSSSNGHKVYKLVTVVNDCCVEMGQKKEPPLPAAQSDNREASNRVDRSHSMSKRIGRFQ